MYSCLSKYIYIYNIYKSRKVGLRLNYLHKYDALR